MADDPFGLGRALSAALNRVTFPATDPLEHAQDCRTAALLLRERAAELTTQACRGLHDPVQHRDGLPAWCGACGRGREGQLIRTDRAPAGG